MFNMKVKKIISKNKDENRMEVIAEDKNGNLYTKHIRKSPDGRWKYCMNRDRTNQPILGIIDI